MTDALILALANVIPNVITDKDLIASYTRDWTGRFNGKADVVVRPKNTNQIAEIVILCKKFGTAIQIQGGNTGLVGGSVPPQNSLRPICLISTSSLNTILDFDVVTGHITVGAGVSVAQVQSTVRAQGWEFPIDLASRESATIGGLVATNAGGIRVCAFGMTKQSVAGIEMVLADGQVISNLTSPLKDNTGYPIQDLAVGAEGTLGIITAVRMKLIRPTVSSTLFVVPCDSVQQAYETLLSVQKAGHNLLAAEYVDAKSMHLIINYSQLRPLWEINPSVTLFIEVAGSNVQLEIDSRALGTSNSAEKRNFWRYRETASDSWTAVGKVHKLDVSVAVHKIGAFEAELSAMLSGFGLVTSYGSFGHLADGNLHIEIVGPAEDDYEVDKSVLELVAKFKGSISAEHGIGRAKREYLGLTRDAIDIEFMQKIKEVFDSERLFNPGVLLPD